MYLQMCNVTIIFIFESYLTNINNNTLQKKIKKVSQYYMSKGYID